MNKFYWNTTNIESGNELSRIWGSYHKKNSYDWIFSLLEKVDLEKISNLDELNSNDKLIIVDSGIENKTSLYSKLNLICSKIFLFHLGDEASNPKVNSIYKMCYYSWRTFCSNIYFNSKNVSCIPIGYKSGIKLKKTATHNNKSNNKWAFIGTPHKSSRQDLLFQLSSIKPFFIHKTEKFNDKTIIESEEMGEVLSDTDFLPCPNGFVHPETYRLYEALECSCIPIVESSYQYYDRLFPNNPFLKIKKWIEAKNIISDWDGGKIRKKRKECDIWWAQLKENFQNNIKMKVG